MPIFFLPLPLFGGDMPYLCKKEEKNMKEYPNCVIPKKGRGFIGIGIECAMVTKNIGTIWRSAQVLGADFMFIIGKRYETMKTDTMKSWKHIPLFEYPDLPHFLQSIPKDATLVGIELDERSEPLMAYKHPERAVYLLGSEDCGLSKNALDACRDVVQIPGKFSLNVSAAASIVLYDRLLKRSIPL